MSCRRKRRCCTNYDSIVILSEAQKLQVLPEGDPCRSEAKYLLPLSTTELISRLLWTSTGVTIIVRSTEQPPRDQFAGLRNSAR